MLVLYPLLAMNAPKQSMARKVTTSVVALGCKNLPVKLTSWLSLGWCRSVVTKLRPQSSTVQVGWQETGHHNHTSSSASDDTQNCEPSKCMIVPPASQSTTYSD